MFPSISAVEECLIIVTKYDVSLVAYHVFCFAGCVKGGSKSVKEHKWFADVDWEAVYNGQVIDYSSSNELSSVPSPLAITL